MDIGIAVRSPDDVERSKRLFESRFLASGREDRTRRPVHAHGAFGGGRLASIATAVLRAALLVLALDSSVEDVWVEDAALLRGIPVDQFPFRIHASKNVSEEADVDVTLKLDGPRDVGQQFKELARRWREETGLLSSMTARIEHPAYQAIIALGQPAVPYLIEEARAGRGLWHAALQAITGDDPVPAEHAGRVRQVALDWVQWAERHGVVRPQ